MHATYPGKQILLIKHEIICDSKLQGAVSRKAVITILNRTSSKPAYI
jgi:hypothetical protein